jgi:TP901-1 family phage major tail protein
VFRDGAADALVRDAFFSQDTRNWRLIIPDFGTLEGRFLIASLDYAGDHEGEVTFALSLASAGPLTFTAA